MTDTNENIPLYLLTYNCNKQKLDYDLVIPKIMESLPDQLSTLYVFGLEELCSIIDGCFVENASNHLIKFNKFFIEALNRKYGTEDVKFHTIGMNHIGAIGIIAITPYPLKFHKLRLGRSGCGYGYSSMKGAAGIRLSYIPEGRHESTKSPVEMTFANFHLSAYEGDHYFQKRNNEVNLLMRSMDFGDGYSLLKPRAHCFVMGDLNYRTTKKYDPNSASFNQLLNLQDQSKLDHGDIEELVKNYDELTEERHNGNIFAGFSEACINFRPTYKYHLNTAIYNRKRSPSWCDRILYQSTYKNNLSLVLSRKKESSPVLPQVHEYGSIQSILSSDHQPVYLSITVPTSPPESIISAHGYLQVLPSETPNNHFRHDTNDQGMDVSDESIIGATQIYMKSTVLDRLIQGYIRKISDFSIGQGLWFSSTSKGRLALLLVALFCWGAYYVI
jgi:hypothetical protein